MGGGGRGGGASLLSSTAAPRAWSPAPAPVAAAPCRLERQTALLENGERAASCCPRAARPGAVPPRAAAARAHFACLTCTTAMARKYTLAVL